MKREEKQNICPAKYLEMFLLQVRTKIQKEKEKSAIKDQLGIVRAKIYAQTKELQLEQRELEKKLKKLG